MFLFLLNTIITMLAKTITAVDTTYFFSLESFFNHRALYLLQRFAGGLSFQNGANMLLYFTQSMVQLMS